MKTQTFISGIVRLKYNSCHSEPERIWMLRMEGIMLYFILQMSAYLWSNKSQRSLSLGGFLHRAIELGLACWALEQVCLDPRGRIACGVSSRPRRRCAEATLTKPVSCLPPAPGRAAHREDGTHPPTCGPSPAFGEPRRHTVRGDFSER